MKVCIIFNSQIPSMDNNMDTLYAEHGHMMHCREVPSEMSLPSYLKLSQACIHCVYLCIHVCMKSGETVSDDF